MRTALVTGATDGIGHETAYQLAARGYRVLVHGRAEAKARAALEALRARGGGEYAPVWGDLSRMAEVRRLAVQAAALAPALDVLVNNAGVFTDTHTLTPDGFELTLAVNHLAPFALTGALRPALEAAPQGRVVNVSSMAHSRGRVVVGDWRLEQGFTGLGAYATSKLMNVLFTHELARRLAGTRVTTSALHPGVITTKLLKAGFGVEGASLAEGAITSVYCATEPSLATVTSRYYSGGKEARCASHANDEALERGLWEASEEALSS